MRIGDSFPFRVLAKNSSSCKLGLLQQNRPDSDRAQPARTGSAYTGTPAFSVRRDALRKVCKGAVGKKRTLLLQGPASSSQERTQYRPPLSFEAVALSLGIRYRHQEHLPGGDGAVRAWSRRCKSDLVVTPSGG